MITKLGSLFDGSGGFPLAGALSGIEPIWASEVEPYPIAVTKSRFPKMKHLGDISKINGAEIEPVDIVCFGSPCQSLSVAGKREGLKHSELGDDETTRSGLFMEAVRIIKEMREQTNGKYPRFALWENVPGAFSSNKGEDFKVVLEELIKIAEPNAVMPEVPKKGWAYADSHCGDGWSLAYRVLDAQFWGVPQRRRRIYLVADFGGQCAREILFKRKGLQGYFIQSRTPWKTTPYDAERSIGADDREGELSIKENKAPIIYTRGYGGNTRQDGISPTIEARAGTGGNNQPIICMATPQNGSDDRTESYGVVSKGNGDAFISRERHTSLSTGGGQAGQGYPCVMESAGFCPEQSAKTRGVGYEEEIAPTLRSGVTPGVAYGISAYESNSMKSSNPHSGVYEADTSRTLDLNGGNPACNQGGIAIVEPVCETIALEGNGQRPSHHGDGYAESNKSYTLNATEKHGVVYAVDQGGGKSSVIVRDIQAPTLTCTHDGSPAVAYGIDVYNQTTTGDKAKTLTSIKCDADHVPCVCTIGLNGGDISPTLISRMSSAVGTTQDNLIVSQVDSSYQEKVGSLYARDYKGVGNQYVDEDKCVVEGEKPRYIVRRLTPTECARLQGFADRWGDIDSKTEFSDEEYKFWLDVRNTHAAINGKQTKEYTKAQMLAWYNKLNSDGAEYKMWGNGIALPTALYVMQGIKEASNESYKD